jgi:hypothetical protein
MTTFAGGLGKAFDIGIGAMPQSFTGSGITGKPISMQNCEGVVVVVAKTKSGGTTDDLAIDRHHHRLLDQAGDGPRQR